MFSCVLNKVLVTSTDDKRIRINAVKTSNILSVYQYINGCAKQYHIKHRRLILKV